MLNPDIDSFIFDLLPMTDKRSYLRSCKNMNKLLSRMSQIESTFHRMLNDTGYFHYRYYSALYIPIHKFTIELIYDEREIPDKYIVPENQILHQFPKIYKKLTERGQIATIEKMLMLNRNNHLEDNIDYVMDGAAKTGNIKLLKHLHESGYRINFIASSAAAKAGKLKTLKWLVDHGAQLNEYVVENTMRGGYMKILKYIVIDKEYPIVGDFFYNAALYGRLKMIKFLHSVTSSQLDRVICGASRGGHLKIIKFALKQGCDIPTDFISCTHFHVLEWLMKNHHLKCDPEMIDDMARSGKLDCLQYVHSRGYDVTGKEVFGNAIASRNMELINWLRDISPDKSPSNEYAVHSALEGAPTKYASHGSLPILILLVTWGYHLSDCDCSIPARLGDLDILQHLFSRGCTLNEKVINTAAEYGHSDIVIWCKLQGCSWSAKTCKKTVKLNCLHVLKWLHYNNCHWNESVCLEAIYNNHIDVLVFALENGCQFGDRCRKAILECRNPAILSEVDNYYARLLSVNDNLLQGVDNQIDLSTSATL